MKKAVIMLGVIALLGCSQTANSQTIESVQTDFELFCYALADCFVAKDIESVNKVINPNGIYIIYRIGVSDVFKSDKRLDTDTLSTFPHQFYPRTDREILSKKKIKYEKLPEFNCYTDCWEKEGFFVDTTKVYRQLSKIIEFEIEYEKTVYEENRIEEIKQLEDNSRKVIFTPIGLVVYVTLMNGKWYLSVVDTVAEDCGA
jgi:hypothetical protein